MSEERVLIKDDSDLYEWIMHGQEERRALGVPEPSETRLTDTVTFKAEWERMQQARTAPWTYYVAIEYKRGAYYAHALRFPEVIAQGETVEAVKKRITEALRAYFDALHAESKLQPFRENRRVVTIRVQPAEYEVSAVPVAGEKIVMDDRALYEVIRQERERRQALGVADEPEEPSDPATVKTEWRRIEQARTAPGTYYAVIEYTHGTYHAHALSFPEVTAQGETVEAVQGSMAEALRAHFEGLRAQGKAVPMREYKRVDTVEVRPPEMTRPALEGVEAVSERAG